MSDSTALFPEKPRLEEAVPKALRHKGDLTDDCSSSDPNQEDIPDTGGLEKVAGKHHDALRGLTCEQRRLAALFFLAKKGRLKDKEGRVRFGLTAAEAAHWRKAAVGTLPAPDTLLDAVKGLKNAGLIEFGKVRKCRVETDEDGTPKEAHSYRFKNHVFPVGVFDQ